MKNLSVLITGGTGSLGTALCRHLASVSPPRRSAVLSHDWQKQEQLKKVLGNPDWLRWFIGDVRDRDRLWRALDGVDYVIHAAAIKEIVTCEYNVSEALATNVVGTDNVIQAAIDRGVKKVLLISTDKAAAATNAYGKTKAMAEALAVASNAYAGSGPTRISVARYGNVMGSNGSVIPLFREQAKAGTVTITDKRMTRFWITMDDAVRFVLECLHRMRGGEIFVPKIPSMRVVDMATAIAPEALQLEVGRRPGEKLHETLITDWEATHTREYDSYYVIEPEHPFWDSRRTEGGKPLQEGFSYCSDTNDRWLSVDEIRTLLSAAPAGVSP